MLSSKYAVGKNIPENELTDASREDGNLHLRSWIDPGRLYISSGRGRGRRGGRTRTRGGRSQRRVIGSRTEAGHRSSTTNIVGFGQLPGWKGRARGRGGRRRGRRSARSRQKQVKRVSDVAGERHDTKEIVFEQTPGISGQQDWNGEEMMPVPVEGTENTSSSEYDDDNGQALGYEYDDLMADDYSSVFNGKSEHLQGVDYGVDGEEDDVDEEEDDDDEEGEDGEEDDQGDVDVEGYIIGDSDEEGNRDVIEGHTQNLEEGSGSSSSEYSD